MAIRENDCFRLNEFGSDIRTTWQQFQKDKDFCDVTMVCNDGQIQTHRIIVSHSSPLLKDILKQSPSQNSVIYLRGVKYKYLESLINFMYQGEVTVSNEDMVNFLNVAQDLKVKGLSPEDGKPFNQREPLENINKVFTINQNDELQENKHKELILQNSVEYSLQGKHRIQKSTSNEGNVVNFLDVDAAVDLKVTGLSPENQEIFPLKKELSGNKDEFLSYNQNEDLHRNSKEEKVEQNCIEFSFQRKHRVQKYSRPISTDSDPKIIDNSLKPELNKEVPSLSNSKYNTQKLVDDKDSKFSCYICEKQYNAPGNLRRHIASTHEGVKYSCDECNAGPFADSAYIKIHKASAHKGVRYSCNECNAGPFTTSNTLWRHTASVHKGVVYPCDQCNAGPYSQRGELREHKASAHEGVRYPCDKCNAGPFTKSNSLRRHTASVHEGVRYPCNECNAGPFTDKSALRMHKNAAHKGVRYPCDQCNVNPFRGTSALRQHKASQHEGVRYPCDECNAGPYTQPQALKNHKASVHEGVRYPCDQCNAGPFTHPDTLKNHKATAHEGVRFECNTCNYKAKSKGHLKKHCIRIHKF